MQTYSRWAARLLIAIVVLLASLLALALAFARVEMTEHGVHRRILVPGIAFPLYTGTGDRVSIPGHLDGPVVRHTRDGEWSATWFCEDRVGRARGRAAVLNVECAGRVHAFPLAALPAPVAELPMPRDVVVLSDIEGNAVFLDRALRQLGIVDDAGQWRFGAGHVVVLGDSVDRGRDVFPVLWRLYALAGQARAAGGAVHMVLGNHEQYMLRTNVSRANPEHLYALNAMGGYAPAFAADTVLGAWLREQPVILKLGDVLFTHGGAGPATAGLTVAQINGAMREYWRTASAPQVRSPALDAAAAEAGVTQYRGYLMPVEGYYPAASEADIDRALQQFGARQTVVAHTKVSRVQRLYGDRVIAVDVNGEGAAPEVLVYRNGVAEVRNIGIARHAAQAEGVTYRDLSLFDAADRGLLAAAFREGRRLASLPHPY